MALSYESNSFHNIKKEIASLVDSGGDTSTKAIRSIVEGRGEDWEDFKRTYHSFKNAEKSGRTDFRPGQGKAPSWYTAGPDPARIAGRFIGDIARLPLTLGKVILPEQIEKEVESYASAIGEKIPLDARTYFDSLFDPYHGDNLIGKIEGGGTTLASIIWGGSGAVRGAVALTGKKGLGITPRIKQAVYQPMLRKMARDTRKQRRAKLEKRGRGVRLGAGFAAAQTLYDPEMNVVDMLLEFFPESLSVLEHLADNPDDPEAQRYLESFLKNLVFEAPLGALLGANKILNLADLEAGRVARTAHRMKNTTVFEEELPLSSLGATLRKWGTSRFGGDDTTLAATIRNSKADAAAISRAGGLIEDAKKIVLDEAAAEGIDVTAKLPKNHPFASLGDTFEEGVINEALGGNMKAFKYLKDNGFTKTNDAVMEMRQNIDDFSDLIIGAKGDMPLVKGQLRATIKSRGRKGKKPGVYLNRAYGVHDDPLFPAWNELDDQIKDKALAYLKRHGVSEDDAIITLKNIIDGTTDTKFKNGIKYITDLGAGSSRIFGKRKDLPQEIRTLMGEIKNPWKNYARTMEKMSVAQAEAEFLHSMKEYMLANKLAVKGTVKEPIKKGDPKIYELPEQATQQNFVSLKDVGKERLAKVIGQGAVAKRQGVNPFEDLFANPEYKEFFREGLDLVGPMGPFWKHVLKLKAITQTNKTVLSSATHGRNTFGNVIIMLANGMNPWNKFGPAFKTAASRIVGKTNRELGDYIADLQLRGVVDSSVRAQTLRKTAGEVFNFEPDTVMGKLSKTWAGKGVQKSFQTYQAEDDIWKIMHYEKTLDDMKKLDLGVDENVLKEMAAEQTRDLMPNYALVPKAIKYLRRTPFSDFPAFSAEMVRISKNLVTRTYDDIAGKTAAKWGVTDPDKKQLIANMGWRRVAGMGLGAVGGEAGVKYSMHVMGLDNDDVDAINRLAPRWEQNTRKIFLSPLNIDKNGHLGVNYVNLGPIDPFHYMRTPAQLLYSALKSGTEVNQTDVTRMGLAMLDNSLGMFVSPSMITKSGLGVLNTLTPEGREKALEEGLLSPEMLSVGQTILTPFIPGVADLLYKRYQYEISKADRPTEGAVTPYEYTMPEMEYRGPGFWGKAIGIRPQRLDITAGMRRNLGAVVRDIDGASSQFTSRVARPLGWTPEKVFNTYKDSQKQRAKEFQRLRSLTNAYDQLLNDARIGDLNHPIITDRTSAIYQGITRGEKKPFNQNIDTYMSFARQDEFKPFWPTENAQRAMDIDAEKTGINIPYDQMRAFHNYLEGKRISQY